MNTIKLEKGIIMLMLPFRMGPGWAFDPAENDSGIWIKTDEDVPKLDFLLDHVKDFFVKNTGNTFQDDSSCLVTKLKKDSVPFKMFNNRIFWLSNRAFDTHDKARKLSKIPVSFDTSAFRLIFHPFTGVAVLMLSIQIAPAGKDHQQSSLADFVEMNYLVRLFNRNDEAYFLSCNERPEERSKALQLTTDKVPGLFEKMPLENIEVTGWRLSHLINYLLHDLNKRFKIEFFDIHRFYPVSYAQPAEEIRDETIIHRALYFLRKVYNFDFTPAYDILQKESEYFHPFRQVYYANSLEGAVVFNNCSKTDPEFIRIFDTNSFQKSLWLTILGVMQRSVFLQLMKEVSRIDPENHQLVKEYLIRYTKTSLKAIFSKVSVYHQHNDYYVMMINNFQINELQNELKDELYDLNNVLRQSHEDEVEKNSLVEKQSGKRLSMILFILSIISLTQVIYGLIGHLSMPLYQHLLAFGIPLCLGLLAWKLIFSPRNSRNKSD